MEIKSLILLVLFGLGQIEAHKRKPITTTKNDSSTGTIVPLYLYPEVLNGVHNWQPLIDAHASHPIPVWAIVNVNSGPSNPIDPIYVDAIARLKAAGIHTLGYVSTNYTHRDAAEVRKDVDTWKSFYNPEGIFFDEMTYVRVDEDVRYYKNLGNYAKSRGYTFTVGNPGTDVDVKYVGVMDTIMIAEDDTGFPSQDEICGWHLQYPKKQWGIFPYNIAKLDEAQILNAKKCVGFIYVSHDVLDNPWDELPAYLNKLFELLQRPV